MPNQPSDDTLRARVFISCGQTKNSEEEKLADEIKKRLVALGFDAYIAIRDHSSRGLKENLFQQIEQSEYFLFVDFRRDLLGDSNCCRGSLFSNQELAVASYLEIDLLAFQEGGVKELDGLLGFIQANETHFSDRSKLPDLVTEHVQKLIDEGKWDPRWRNELVLERESGQFADVPAQDEATGKLSYGDSSTSEYATGTAARSQ